MLRAAVAGTVGVIGILGLYHGLAVGRMGVVAPVTGVLAASLPVIAGMAMAGLPSPQVLVGIGLALAAVVLVSRIPSDTRAQSGIEFALVGGVGIGLFSILIGQLPHGEVFGPLVVVKLASAVVLIGMLAIGRRAWRVGRPAVWVALAAGLFDMSGNSLFVLATQAGRLDIAATLSSCTR